MLFLKGLPHPVLTHSPFQPPGISPCRWSPSPHSPALPGSWPCRMMFQLGLAWPWPRGDAQCLGLPPHPALLLAAPTPCQHPFPHGLLTGGHIPTSYLWLFVTTAPLCLTDKVYTELSLSMKKEVLNIKCPCGTLINASGVQTATVHVEKHLASRSHKNWENNVKIKQRWALQVIDPQNPGKPPEPLPHGWTWCWHRGSSQGLMAPSQRVWASWAARHCCLAVKPVSTGHLEHHSGFSSSVSADRISFSTHW